MNMAKIECHYCLRMFDESEIRYHHAFGNGAQRSEIAGSEGLDIIATISDKPTAGAVPICPKCLDELMNRP